MLTKLVLYWEMFLCYHISILYGKIAHLDHDSPFIKIILIAILDYWNIL